MCIEKHSYILYGFVYKFILFIYLPTSAIQRWGAQYTGQIQYDTSYIMCCWYKQILRGNFVWQF
jgi:hypothetical protein